jgi:hypothetical protein
MARRRRPLRGRRLRGRRLRPCASFALSSAPLRGLAGPGGRYATLRSAASMRLRYGRHRAAAGVLLRGILAPQFLSHPLCCLRRAFLRSGGSVLMVLCLRRAFRRTNAVRWITVALSCFRVFPTFEATAVSQSPSYGSPLVLPPLLVGQGQEAPR